MTPRQSQVLELIARGLTNKEMAHLLRISERGVAAHVSHLLLRFGVHNRAGLVARSLAFAPVGRAGERDGPDLALTDAMLRDLEPYATSSLCVGLSLGADFRLAYVNEAFRRTFGMGTEDPRTPIFVERRAIAGGEAARRSGEEAVRTGRAVALEGILTWLRDDGVWERGSGSCIVQPVRDGADVVGVLWICMLAAAAPTPGGAPVA